MAGSMMPCNMKRCVRAERMHGGQCDALQYEEVRQS